jgi:PiT family inorganic phosphate transporter
LAIRITFWEEIMLTTIFIIVILALAFDFINGFHDTANAIATSISTRALSPRAAIIMATSLNFLGAMLFSGVAKTVGSQIANPIHLDPHIGTHAVIAALSAAIIWNLLTWYYGIPSSSSHTLIGSLVGGVLAAAGSDAVNWKGFIEIVVILILSPVLAFIAGYIIMWLIKALVLLSGNQSRTKLNKSFRFLQIFSAASLSFSHGGNDAQKAMGIIVFGLVAAGYQTGFDVPLWVKICAATAMGLGTSIGGWKIINTVSKKIIKIEPINGFASDLTSSLIIQISTFFGKPLSTTHVITSSIIGTGSVMRFHELKWATITRMITTWIITIPSSIVLAYTIYKFLYVLL